MRFAFVPSVVFAASFSLATAQTATIDPGLKLDQTRPTPPPTPVYVLNFPDTQPVSGTVNIGNLPAVQEVGGTLNIGNLPLAEDGSVRVSSASGTTRQEAVFELLSSPISIAGVTGPVDLPTIVDTRGYSSYGVYVRGGTTDWGATASSAAALWRWSDDENFASLVDVRGASPTPPCPASWNVRYLCPNPGGFLQIRLGQNGPANTVYSVRVYLFP